MDLQSLDLFLIIKIVLSLMAAGIFFGGFKLLKQGLAVKPEDYAGDPMQGLLANKNLFIGIFMVIFGPGFLIAIWLY